MGAERRKAKKEMTFAEEFYDTKNSITAVVMNYQPPTSGRQNGSKKSFYKHNKKPRQILNLG